MDLFFILTRLHPLSDGGSASPLLSQVREDTWVQAKMIANRLIIIFDCALPHPPF